MQKEVDRTAGSSRSNKVRACVHACICYWSFVSPSDDDMRACMPPLLPFLLFLTMTCMALGSSLDCCIAWHVRTYVLHSRTCVYHIISIHGYRRSLSLAGSTCRIRSLYRLFRTCRRIIGRARVVTKWRSLTVALPHRRPAVRTYVRVAARHR